MPKFSVFLFLLVHSITLSQQIGINNQILLDSLLVQYSIDTDSITSFFYSSDIKDGLSFEVQQVNKSCTDYLLFFPQLINIIPSWEYDLLFLHEEQVFDDCYEFILGNDILSSLYRIHKNNKNEIVKAERISIDINVDFGDVISTLFFKDNLLRVYVNDYCYRINNTLIIRTFEYEKLKLTGENVYTLKDSIIAHEKKVYD
ncbi:MAG TPA: hypothetical protein PK397_04115 [Ignavibacteriaceae bacterium]|nr:hypothetical protein [Ignavibacteriaceae bacterium]